MRFALLLTLTVLLLAACGPKDDPILQLSAEDAMQIGKDFLEQKKYYKARRHLSRAFEASPNSPLGREALLLVADTFYLQGGQANLIQAEAKYRDYLNRFPTSQRAAYAQLQIGNTLAQRVRKPDRDQSITENAERAYREVLELFPTTEYAAQAREELATVRTQLAEHEFSVGYFYIRYGLPGSAVQRFEGLLDNFPDYPSKDKVYYYIGIAQQRARQPAKALLMFDKLRREYPESEYLKKIPKVELPPENDAVASEETTKATDPIEATDPEDAEEPENPGGSS